MKRGHRARVRFNQLKQSWIQEHHTAEEIKSEKLRQEWKHLEKEKYEQEMKEKKANQLKNEIQSSSQQPPPPSSPPKTIEDSKSNDVKKDDIENKKTSSLLKEEKNDDSTSVDKNKNDKNENNKNENENETVKQPEKSNESKDDNNNENNNNENNNNENNKEVENDKKEIEDADKNNPKESEIIEKPKTPPSNEIDNEVSKPKTPQETKLPSPIKNEDTTEIDNETKLMIKQILDDLIVTLESMTHLQEPIDITPPSQNNHSIPLETSRTEHTSHTNLTDYTMVTDNTDELNDDEQQDPIDEEALKKQMRSAYLKEWADMRGLTFETDDEAEKALQEFQNRRKTIQKKDSLPPPPPVVEEKIPESPTPIEIPPLDLKSKIEPAEITPILEEKEGEDLVTPLVSTARRLSRSKSSRKNSSSSTSSKSSSARRKSSLFDTNTINNLNNNNNNTTNNGNDSDEDKLEKYDEIRKNIPQNELDALLGFFPELRAEISELLRKKRHLKLDISEWKAEFFIQNGREASWEERKEAIGTMYEKYHEVGFKANKALKELRESENELLKSWESRRQLNISPRKRKMSIRK